MVEIADVFRRYGPAYREKYGDRMPRAHLRVMETIEQCRTMALGGHVYLCTDCGRLEYSYHSCKDRHCPKCQNGEASSWLDRQKASLLPVPYFMATFTLPGDLRPLARSHQRELYGMMFRASADALLTLARDSRHLGGLVGMVGVLQTWSREMLYHPHIHYLLPAGAVSADGTQWVEPRHESFLLPEKALAMLFKGKLGHLVKKAGLNDQVPKKVWRKKWTVDCQPVGSGAEACKYLAPYILRIAISNKRIKAMSNGRITFLIKNRSTKKWEDRTVTAEEFIRRFLLHVLPKGFQKVRYYGLLHPYHQEKLESAKELLGHAVPLVEDPQERQETCSADTDTESRKEAMRCRKCGQKLQYVRRLDRNIRAPPASNVLTY